MPDLEAGRSEVREDDSLVIFWPNGDPGIRFQADGFVCFAYPGAHVLDTVAITLGDDVLERLRDWVQDRIDERAGTATK